MLGDKWQFFPFDGRSPAKHDAKEGDVTYSPRITHRFALIAALLATIAMLTLAALAAGGGFFGDGVQKQSISHLSHTVAGKTVSSKPSRRA